MDKFIMTIFGASGDLTRRKLMPALYYLHKEKRLPDGFTIIGTGRTAYSNESYQAFILENLKQFVPIKHQIEGELEAFVQKIYYLPMDPEKGAEYIHLYQLITKITQNNLPEDLLFYLATPPSLYGVIPQQLKKIGLNGKNARIIVEKPFGYDLKSAMELNKIYASVFKENQIYRIDHFLGKETVQNLLVFRFANGIFEPLWNRNYINYIEVTGVENLGIEQRGGFYDSTGALRDMVQNHLIQLLAIIAMEPPATFNADNFRNEVVQVYESLKPLTEQDLKEHVIRGQYISSDYHPGYREEKNIPPDSRTETYIAMRLEIQNWRWAGVPFYIRTGKQMPTKVTEIVIHFREAPMQMFNLSKSQIPKENKLILRLQPNEGITLSFGMKVPGRGFEMKEVMMDFGYDSLEGIASEDAYIRLIEDCIHQDPTLFTRSDAVEASWKYFEPVLQYWKKNPDATLHGYPAGSWGPLESEEMIHRYHAEWTNPCKNRTNTDIYCEL